MISFLDGIDGSCRCAGGPVDGSPRQRQLGRVPSHARHWLLHIGRGRPIRFHVVSIFLFNELLLVLHAATRSIQFNLLTPIPGSVAKCCKMGVAILGRCSPGSRYLRGLPRVQSAFATVWGCRADELITSFEGTSAPAPVRTGLQQSNAFRPELCTVWACLLLCVQVVKFGDHGRTRDARDGGRCDIICLITWLSGEGMLSIILVPTQLFVH